MQWKAARDLPIPEMLPYTCWRSLCVQPDHWRHASRFSLHPPAVRKSNCRHPSQTPRRAGHGRVKPRAGEAPPPPWVFRLVICLRPVNAGYGFRERPRAGRIGRDPAGESSVRRRPAVGSSIAPRPIGRWSMSEPSARSGLAGLSGSGCTMRNGGHSCGKGNQAGAFMWLKREGDAGQSTPECRP